MSASPNPIHDLLTHGAQRPTGARLAAIRAAASAAGLASGLPWTVALVNGQSWLLGFLETTPIWVVLAYLAGGLLAAAVITARFARADGSSLLRLTRLTARQVAGGYVEGVGYRLGLLRTIILWFVAGAGLSLSANLAAMSALYNGFAVARWAGLLLVQVPATVTILAPILACVALTGKSMQVIGVWIGLKWPARAAALAGAASAMVAAIGVLVVASSLLLTFDFFGLSPTCLVALVISPIITWPARRFAFEDIIRSLDGSKGIRLPLDEIAPEG